MRRRAFVAALILAPLLGACGKETRLPAHAPGTRVLAFGDSVTYGTGAGPGEDWPTVLAGRTGWQIVNAGIPGDTAEAGKARIQALLDTHRPQLVIVEIGGNDFLRRRAPRAVKEDIRQILAAVRQSGAQAVLVAVPEMSLLGLLSKRPSDAPMFAELAEEEGVPLVPDVFSGVLGRPELCADQIHPNASGYRQMAAGIHAALLQVGLAQQ